MKVSEKRIAEKGAAFGRKKEIELHFAEDSQLAL